MQFINGQTKLPPPETIFFGMVFGVIFGFLDNFFLFMGIDSLGFLMPDDVLVKAGLGNTFSDVIGAIIGTFISTIGKQLVDYDDDTTPMWANTIGIFIGYLLGLYVPILFRKIF